MIDVSGNNEFEESDSVESVPFTDLDETESENFEESESVSDNGETQSEVVVDNSTTYTYDFTNLESIGFLILVSVIGFGCMMSFVLGLNTK